LLLEPGTYAYTERLGHNPSTWNSSQSGLFSAQPHLVFEENFWDATARATTTRYYVVDATTGEVTRFAGTYQAYTDQDLTTLLQYHGFGEIKFYPTLSGVADRTQQDFMAVVARKN
jgi:hypothetical protein